MTIMRMLWQTMREMVEWKMVTVGYNWCYIVSKLNALQLLTGKQVTDDKYRNFLTQMRARWHNPSRGMVFTAGTKDVIDRWKSNYGDDIAVEEISLFSPKFFVNIFRKIPMVISIGVSEQFKADREDGILSDIILDDQFKTWHATVVYGWEIYDSRRDQKRYSFTRQYIISVVWLLRYRKALVFKIK